MLSATSFSWWRPGQRPQTADVCLGGDLRKHCARKLHEAVQRLGLRFRGNLGIIGLQVCQPGQRALAGAVGQYVWEEPPDRV